MARVGAPGALERRITDQDGNNLSITSDGHAKVKSDAQKTEDGKTFINTENTEICSLLREVITELKILNLHHVKITDETIKPRDL